MRTPEEVAVECESDPWADAIERTIKQDRAEVLADPTEEELQYLTARLGHRYPVLALREIFDAWLAIRRGKAGM